MTTYSIHFSVFKHNPSDDLAELWEGYNLAGSWSVQKVATDEYRVSVERTINEDLPGIMKIREHFRSISHRRCAVLHLRNELAQEGEWQAVRLLDRDECVVLAPGYYDFDTAFDTFVGARR